MPTFQKLKAFIAAIETEIITDHRKRILQPLIDFVQEKIDRREEIRLNFMCTHNSRRSHLAQVWAQTMASYFGLERVFCYSSGTEATALVPAIAKTLQHTGFQIETLSNGENPVYSIKYAANAYPIIGFSKTHDHCFNPQSRFAAIMTCAQADENCPVISGAEKRMPITYDDPKKYDNTPQKNERYYAASLQIATEMRYVFATIHMR